MFHEIFQFASENWFFATLFSVSALNESAIVAAFSLAASFGAERMAFVALAAAGGVLLNDVIIYVLTRFGVAPVSKKYGPLVSREPALGRWLGRNVFVSFLFVKFLFGVRTIATMYLITSARMSFSRYVVYSVSGIVVYIATLAPVGILIGKGIHGIATSYSGVTSAIAVLAGGLLVAQVMVILINILLRRSREPRSRTRLQEGISSDHRVRGNTHGLSLTSKFVIRPQAVKARGFTLIELLIVIAIIGVLASIVLVSLSSTRERAQNAKFKAEVHSVQTKAIEACDSGAIDYNDSTGSFGNYPSSVDPASIVEVDQQCGPFNAGTFTANITSSSLAVPCTAVIEETGITSFTDSGGNDC